ncbi:Imm26 family immunity protein [Chitinophaga sp. sic0106]|uniref:Imm26 family immunity protein n=1 Tax=Chitinophaga sp. sic0106 TaxID=2854785 RepID=UPI001C463995|nr:Imm26 family immunity protein [Chitinophaga sp. sic0106]MBV7531176.1 immunity 26/phosphotriesterase HocA family protein [Chitinophaga sp. sic0106]
MAKQRITAGAVLKIQLPCGKIAYGRILGKANYAFYNYFTDIEETNIDVICNAPILFILAVYNDIITSGRWIKIGKKELEPFFDVLPMKFIYDDLGERYKLYNPITGEISPASLEDCLTLETAAVWDAHHVEGRLCDYINGVPNETYEKMRPGK